MICLNCTTYSCSCHGGVVGLVYKNLINETEEKLKKKTNFDEDEGNDWWFRKLNAIQPSKNKKINDPCNLTYCKKCDRLHERAGSSGGKYPKDYEVYFKRGDLSFYGFIDDKSKYKICKECNAKKSKK